MIFFDIDGTLLDQKRAEAVGGERFLREFGQRMAQPCDVETFCRRWRAARENHLRDWFRGAISYQEYHRRRIREVFLDGPALSDAECDARAAAFLEEYQAAWSLYDDVPRCLDALQGVSLGIIANGNARLQRRKLERTGILDCFPVVAVSEEVGCAKPHRTIFLEACRRAGREPSRCWYLGDRPDTDARASSAAGLKGLWVNREQRENPAGLPAIGSFDELPAKIGHAAAIRCRVTGAVPS